MATHYIAEDLGDGVSALAASHGDEFILMSKTGNRIDLDRDQMEALLRFLKRENPEVLP